MDWFFNFPDMSRSDLREFKKTVDFAFTDFSRTYGQGIEEFFEPLLMFLVWFEKLFINTPWPVIPLGIAMARSNKVQAAIVPVLDVMQTIPSFVYLIPVVMLLGIGKVPGLIAVCIYAIPPIVRLTNLGIRFVDKDVLEAADSFGANYWQKLFGVQMPLALPTIFAGVNQTIMMALAMVVIASMIGVKGLGLPVLRAISNQYLALGLMNGLAIVILAIIFDRVTQKFGLRMQKYRNEGKD